FNALYRDLSKEANLELGLEVKQDKKEKIISNAEKGTYIRIRSKEDLNTLCDKLTTQKILSVDTETTSTNPMLAEILGISISFEEKSSYYIPIQHPKSKFNSESFPIGEVVQSLKSILENPNILKIGQNIKYDSIILKKYGIDITPIHFDTMLASYVLSPEGRRHNMDDLASEWLGYKTITYEELTKKGKKQVPLYEIPLDEVTEYAGEDADITLRLYHKLKPEVEKQGLQEILENIEIPLITVLRDMEMTGVSIDDKYLKELSKEYHARVSELEKEIFKLIGHSFNLNSTKELQVVLYDELKLPKVKLTATGISTDHSALESIADKHPSIPLLLEYRKLTKLLNTYIDALPKMINPNTRRIHTSFNQTIAATGRLSSTDPNLQNIPIKDKEGKQIRKAFVPSSNEFEILSLDYSQIELRIMAHFSKDPNMIKAYLNNIDIHSQTASALFGVNEHLVTPEQRNKAKIVNFSVIYGTSAYGLAEQLKISKTEAGIFIDKYFLQYPKVKEFMEKISKECFEKGYVETLTGRRRYIPEIKSSKRQEVEAAKRIAINSP
ncbi:MAG: DNA polymerase, partial [Leptospiraceae bacterium]|nr:DNA polymerase [Leptospiraceae bacterium]